MSFDCRYWIGLACLAGIAVSPALAQSDPRKSRQEPVVRTLKPASSNPCADFGAGFVRVEGSNTCVKVGGAISVGVGATR